MNITRYYNLDKELEIGKVNIIYGPRRAGKTFLIESFLKNYKGEFSLESGTFRNVQEKFLDGPRKEVIDNYGLNFDLVVIDEAQNIKNIGESMKALIDTYPNICIILTGSSSFELEGQIGEPLFGRQKIFTLFPFWEKELLGSGLKYSLEDRLLYGSFPQIVLEENPEKKIENLKLLSGASLFKDVLAFDRLKKPKILLDLVAKLAWQVGNEVSYSELGADLGINDKTVGKYIDLLEKTFVIFTLDAFSTNERNEIRKKKKYYFFDLGIRNAMINAFNNLNNRNDTGALWENFCVVERYKKNIYTHNWNKSFFWRSYTGGEIDYLEIANETKSLFEFKFSENKSLGNKEKANLFFNQKINLVNRDNYRDFII